MFVVLKVLKLNLFDEKNYHGCRFDWRESAIRGFKFFTKKWILRFLPVYTMKVPLFAGFPVMPSIVSSEGRGASFDYGRMKLYYFEGLLIGYRISTNTLTASRD